MDRLVEWLASVLDAVGLNGRRLRWRWMRRKREMAESGAQAEVMLRSAKGKHKMCPACRALVDKSLKACPECGESLHRVSVPSPGRFVSNLLPGVTAATSLLMLVNGLLFVLTLMAQIKSGGGGGLLGGIDGETLVRFGSGLNQPRLLSDGTLAGGEWWRLVTPIFLHGGLIHIAFNSYMLIQLGPLVEQIYGSERFWVIYLFTGIVGFIASEGLHGFVNTVGASGAIFGLIGVLLAYGRREHRGLNEAMKGLLMRLLIYTLLMVFMRFPIDHFAHGGGFVAGFACGYLVPAGPYRTRGAAIGWQAAAVAGVGLVVYCFLQVARNLG